ncbi:MAG TPA: glycoside hydrolase family 5 protein, partial [Polyangiaceae bacterium]|nr:glycoside hydrolase family 5 protein [Polyangiaceae bacterium]
ATGGNSVASSSGGNVSASGGATSASGGAVSASGGATTPGGGPNGTSGGSVTVMGGASSVAGATSGGASAGGSDSSTPVGKHGQLAVVGTQLVDQQKQPVQLKGPSSMWLNWESKPFAEDKAGLQWMRDNWKASVVRAAMGVSTTDTMDVDYLSAPEAAQAQVEKIIQNAIDLGIYVIVDWHDGAADTRQDKAIAFFKSIAQKFGSYPNVIYETFNEPTRQAWSTVLKPYHTAVVAAIREVDPDNVIILGTRNWSQFVDEAAADPVAGTNLMYTLHFYSCTHKADIRTRGETALGMGLPLFVTEWGATHADGGTPKNPMVCADEAQLWHDWMNKNKISWAAWKWDQCVDQSCYFKPDIELSTAGNWTDDMLNGHATFVRDRMKE